MFLSVLCIALVATTVSASNGKNNGDGVGVDPNGKVITTQETLKDGTIVKTSSSSASFSTSSQKQTSSSSSSSSDERSGKKKPLGSHSFASSTMQKNTDTHEEKKGGFNLGNKFSQSFSALRGSFERSTTGLKERFQKGNPQ